MLFFTPKKSRLSFIACLLANITYTPLLFAESDKKIELTEVIALKLNDRKTTADIDLDHYTGFETIVDREIFEDRYTDLNQLLNKISSVQVRTSGGFGSQSSVSIRGSSSKQINYYIDGLLLNSSFSGYSNIQLIPTAMIERIEIYPDFTPVELANANLYGAINFKTRSLTKDEQGGQLQLAAGSFGTYQAQGSYWAEHNSWEILANFDSRSSDNNYPVDADFFSPKYNNAPVNADLLSTKSTERVNNRFKASSGFVKFAKNFEDLYSSTFISYTDYYKELATSKNQLRDKAATKTGDLIAQTLVDYQIGTLELNHRFFINKQHNLFEDPNGSLSYNGANNITDQLRLGLNNAIKLPIGAHTISMGLELFQDDFTQEKRVSNTGIIESKQIVYALSLADSWAISDQWRSTLVTRYTASDERLSKSTSQENNESDTSGSSYQLGIIYNTTASLKLKANIGQAYRIPTLDEKYGSSGLYVGEPNLLPEESDLFDIGVEWRHSMIYLSSVFYYKELTNGIVISTDSLGIAKSENIGQSNFSGLDNVLKVKPFDWITITLFAHFIQSENLSQKPSQQGKKLPGIYHDSYGLSTDLHFDNFDITASFQRDDEMFYQPSNVFKADQKDMIDFSFIYYFDIWSLDLTARNLLDENYLDYNNMPSAGRSYIATLTIDF